jgi:hypothetical protein
MPRRVLLLVVAQLALVLAACTPQIGDPCSVSTDCSATGDRLCDTTEPGGYCTIFNCEPGTCPDEAICVAFDTYISSAPGCNNPQTSPRFERTFCMRKCESNSDCRSGYECFDMNRPNNAYGATVVEYGASQGKVNGHVCAVPASGAPVSLDAATGVCTGTDAGFDVPDGQVAPGDASEASSDATTDALADATKD